MKYSREISLYKPILDMFGIEYNIFAEVPFIRKSVDLIFSCVNDDILIAVELKISNWKRALKQAAENQLFADYAYVALSADAIPKRKRSAMEEQFILFGVGLISVDDELSVLIQPSLSRSISDVRRRSMREKLSHASVNGREKRKDFEHGRPAKKPRSTAFLPAGAD